MAATESDIDDEDAEVPDPGLGRDGKWAVRLKLTDSGGLSNPKFEQTALLVADGLEPIDAWKIARGKARAGFTEYWRRITNHPLFLERVRMLVVPGSVSVQREAEAEGLDQVFRQAGAEWREPGCSMCIAMNGDLAKPGQLVVSTSNRNFEGRQGPGSRTVLASPRVAAASALAGCIADPLQYVRTETEQAA